MPNTVYTFGLRYSKHNTHQIFSTFHKLTKINKNYLDTRLRNTTRGF